MSIRSNDIPPALRKQLGLSATKHRNKPTRYGDRTYDSKLEAERARQLDILKDAGEIAGWSPQVVFDLAGFQWRCDFVVYDSYGTCHAEDTTGQVTQRKRDAIRMWRKHGPMPLWIVTRKGTEVVECQS